MCLKRVKIKAGTQAGIMSAYVPCGICEDCRRKQAQAWSFRLNAEFLNLKKRGWNVAFCTLTYRPECLPTIPAECFVHSDEVCDIPCFNRSQVREWIDNIRQYCKYHFSFKKENRMRFFIASELGTLRHRPHYHAILAWPNSVSYEEMHSICSQFWKYGFLFPRKHFGDGKCKPFEVVGDASKVLTYVSKYVCKDLELLRLQENIEFYSEKKKYEEDSFEMFAFNSWRNCQSFHIQSQSLGFEAIKQMTDEEKMSVYRNGLVFSADKPEPQQVPIYIKHKLIFDPYYIFDESGKRLVRRKANDFFLRHAHEIFDMKSEFYQKYCCASESKQYYIDRGLSESLANELSSKICYFRSILDRLCPDLNKDNLLGKKYLAYHRVNPDYCYPIELCHQWLLRYFPDVHLSPMTKPDSFHYSLSYFRTYWDLVDAANSLLGSIHLSERTEQAKRVSECLDFFKTIKI